MGVFNDINNAVETVGDYLTPPSMDSITAMKNASTSLNVTANLDPFVLEQGFPGHGNAFYQQLQEVQNLSDAFDDCGNYAQDAVQAAAEDYIKNTGIQQAGRDLAKTLGQDKDLVDCVAGFATLFDSKGIIDDALGLGDLPQIQTRIQQILLDITDPTKLANMITNLDAVQGLLQPFNDFCTGLKDAFNRLIAKDLASLNAILNKLSQWAAFINLATGDPCALVNNRKIFDSITNPVMDDLLDLYDGVIGGDIGDTLGDLLAPDIPTALIGGGGFTQAPGNTTPFNSYFSTLGTDVGGVVTSIGTISASRAEEEEALANNYLVWSEEEKAWVNDSTSLTLSGVEAIQSGLESNDNLFNPALDNFKQVKEQIEFEAMKNDSDSQKEIKVEGCYGKSGDNSKGKEPCLSGGDTWYASTYTTPHGHKTISDISQYQLDSTVETSDGTQSFTATSVATSEELAIADSLGVGIADVPSGSGSDVINPPKTKKSKIRTIKLATGYTSPSVVQGGSSKSVVNKESRPQDRTPNIYARPANVSTAATKAKIQSPNVTDSFESSITQFDTNLNNIKGALHNGNFSNVTISKCVGALGGDIDSCKSNGGIWKSQTGTVNQTGDMNIKSKDMITSRRNVELSSIFPSSSAFKGIS
jgi:hypothetical protein